MYVEMVVYKDGYMIKAPQSVGQKQANKHSNFIKSLTQKKSRERYFVLEGSKLLYFDRDAKNGGKQKGYVQLGVKSTLKVPSGDPLSLVLVPFPGSKKELYLSCKSEQDVTEWKTALQKAIRESPLLDTEEQKECDTDSDEDSVPNTGSFRLSTKKVSVMSWDNLVNHQLSMPTFDYQFSKSGFMERHVGGKWSKKYFLLQKDLFVYDSITAFESNKKGICMPLDGVLVSLLDTREKQEFELITLQGSLHLRCDTPAEAREWVRCLENWCLGSRVVNRPVYGSCDTSVKKVPDFLREVTASQTTETNKTENHGSVHNEKEGTTEQQVVETPTISEIVQEESNLIESQPVVEVAKEDRFAKLRALRANKEKQKVNE